MYGNGNHVKKACGSWRVTHIHVLLPWWRSSSVQQPRFLCNLLRSRPSVSRAVCGILFIVWACTYNVVRQDLLLPLTADQNRSTAEYTYRLLVGKGNCWFLVHPIQSTNHLCCIIILSFLLIIIGKEYLPRPSKSYHGICQPFFLCKLFPIVKYVLLGYIVSFSKRKAGEVARFSNSHYLSDGGVISTI